MSQLREQHEAHIARRQRLWPSRAQVKTGAPITVAIEPPPPPAPEIDRRAKKLADIQKEVESIGKNITAAMAAEREAREIYIRQTPITLILKTVCTYYGIRLQDMLAQRRTRTVVLPRQIAMYLARELTVKSLPEIGRRFCGRDHTTVLHAARKIEAARKTNPDLDAEITELIGILTVHEVAEEIPAFLQHRKE